MNVYRRSLGYFKGDAGKVVLSLVMIVATTILGVLLPVPLAIMVRVFGGQTQGPEPWLYRLFAFVPRDGGTRMVIWLSVVLLVIRMAIEIIRGLQTQLTIVVGYHGRARVQAELFQKLQALSLKYHKTQPQGDAIYRLSNDTHGIHGVLNIVVGSLVNVATLLFMIVTMLTLQWKLTLIAIGVIPLLLLTITRFGKRLHRFNVAQREADQGVTTQVQRSLATVGLVQAFNREADELGRFTTRQRGYIDTSLRLHWEEIIYWFVLGTILAVASTALLGYGGVLVAKGKLGVDVLTIFLAYLAGLYDPLNKLAGSNAALQGSAAGAKRVFEVLDRDAIVFDPPNASPLPVQPRTLRLDDVSFEYRENMGVLRGIDVTIEPGNMVAFVGPSGVGKTTLLNLLPRFYDPSGGKLTLDGHDLRDVKLADVRRHVALVLQENPILPTTVAENIAYGRPDATVEQIEEAARLAGASEFIDKLPEKFDEQISEYGGNLSGGQRQRVAIARALCTEAPILVLDEPTSALDPEHEQHIIEALRSMKGRRTVIIVSHRLSTVMDCDLICVMDAGRIVERGTHEELVAARGRYFSMARHQLRIGEDN